MPGWICLCRSPSQALPSDVLCLSAAHLDHVRSSHCRLRPTYEDVWRAVRLNFVAEAPERKLRAPDVWIVGNATDVTHAGRQRGQLRGMEAACSLRAAQRDSCLWLYSTYALRGFGVSSEAAATHSATPAGKCAEGPWFDANTGSL